MNIDAAFPSKRIKADDLAEGPKTVTIDHVEMAELDDGNKPEVFFMDHDQSMILNKTNATAIKEMYGAESDGWRGKRITIVRDYTDFQGKRVACVRVNPGVPPAEGGSPEPGPGDMDPNEEVPF